MFARAGPWYTEGQGGVDDIYRENCYRADEDISLSPQPPLSPSSSFSPCPPPFVVGYVEYVECNEQPINEQPIKEISDGHSVVTGDVPALSSRTNQFTSIHKVC